MKTVRVLSLDWDWFFDYGADGKKEELLPDPRYECCGREILCPVFAEAYLRKQNGIGLKQLSAAPEKIKAVLRLLHTLHRTSFVMVRESHAALYGMLKKRYPDVVFSLVHADHHHDFFAYSGAEPDSGSWASALYRENRLAHCLWIKNPSSCMTTDDRKLTEWIPPEILSVTDHMDGVSGEFDVVFLCRSGIWAPPHEDSSFASLRDAVLQVPSDETDADEEAYSGFLQFYSDVLRMAGEKSLEAVMRGFLPAEIAAGRFDPSYLPARTAKRLREFSISGSEAPEDAYDAFADEYRNDLEAEITNRMMTKKISRAEAYSKALSFLYDRENGKGGC